MSDTPTFILSGGARIRGAVADAIEAQIGKLRAQPGCRVVGVVEIERFQINQMDDADTDPTVLLRLSQLELAKGEQEALLRQSMLALHLHRTAGGTLTEDADVSLAQDTLDKLPDLVSTFESARLRAAFQALVDRVTGLSKNTKHNDGDLRRELKKLADLGARALAGEQLTIDGTGKMPAKSSVPVVDLEQAIAAIPDESVGPPA
jgi:hypothetical protein